MASLGQLSAGLMHEINNPLNFANTALHILKKRLASSPVAGQETLAKPLTDVQDGVQRVVGIVSSLRSFTHPDNSTFERVSLSEVVTSAVRFVQFDPQQISLKVDLPEPMELWGNKNQLIHLIINFLQNAIDSLHEKGAALKLIQVGGLVRDEEIEDHFLR